MLHCMINYLAPFLLVCVLDAQVELISQRKKDTEIGHLKPVNPYSDEELRAYATSCYKLLRVVEFERSELFVRQKYGTLVMLRKPSFRPEECLAIRETDNGSRCELAHVIADKNIWYSMNEDNNKSNKVSTKTTSKSLDQKRAVRIVGLWTRMLRGVRYSEGGSRSNCPDDGETYEFRHTYSGMYGEACTPQSGSPKLFADLGNSLIMYCTASSDQSAKALETVDEKCEELEHLLNSADKVEK